MPNRRPPLVLLYPGDRHTIATDDAPPRPPNLLVEAVKGFVGGYTGGFLITAALMLLAVIVLTAP